MTDWLIEIRELKQKYQNFFNDLFKEVILFHPHDLQPLIDQLILIDFIPKEIDLPPEIYISFRYFITQGQENLLTYEQALRNEQCVHHQITFRSDPHLTTIIKSDYVFDPNDEKDTPNLFIR